MKYCTNCGTKLKDDAKFCTNCGQKITTKKTTNTAVESSHIEDKNDKPHVPVKVIKQINKKIELENNQTPITRKLWYAAGFFLLIDIIAYLEIVDVHPAIAFLSFFFFICSVIIGFMFRNREEKLQKLITGENLIASWTLTPEQKKQYVNYLFEQEKGKNVLILLVISAISIVVFGIFILVIDEGKLAMLGVLVGLIVFLSIFAFGMPYYYKYTNSKGDGNILLGSKYAYVNGYFHNWDFPLSGISKAEAIKEPFYGLQLVYYYTDRTLKHSEEIFIPVNEDIDLNSVVQKIKDGNKKSK